jgi:prevent-host-death family protein
MTILSFWSEHTVMSVDNSNINVWTVAEVGAKLSEVIERALSGEPQTIRRKGRSAVVIVAAEEWEPKSKRAGNLAEFFATSPLRGSGLSLMRLRASMRKVKL